jgi:hypothetical protein
MKFYEIERIKRIIGLTGEAGNREIEARLAELMDKEHELKTMKDRPAAPEKKGWRWWK